MPRPLITPATLLAQLKATYEADVRVRFGRLLGPGVKHPG